MAVGLLVSTLALVLAGLRPVVEARDSAMDQCREAAAATVAAAAPAQEVARDAHQQVRSAVAVLEVGARSDADADAIPGTDPASESVAASRSLGDLEAHLAVLESALTVDGDDLCRPRQ